ncbi:cupin domain-containing protein, partial [Rhizobium johnstonii]
VCLVCDVSKSTIQHTGDVVTEKTKNLDAQRSHLPA